MPTGVAEIEGTDKRNGYQHNDGSQKGVNDHRFAPEELTL